MRPHIRWWLARPSAESAKPGQNRWRAGTGIREPTVSRGACLQNGSQPLVSIPCRIDTHKPKKAGDNPKIAARGRLHRACVKCFDLLAFAMRTRIRPGEYGPVAE